MTLTKAVTPKKLFTLYFIPNLTLLTIFTFIRNNLLVFRLELGSSSIRNTFSRSDVYCHFLNAIMQNSINAVTTSRWDREVRIYQFLRRLAPLTIFPTISNFTWRSAPILKNTEKKRQKVLQSGEAHQKSGLQGPNHILVMEPKSSIRKMAFIEIKV